MPRVVRLDTPGLLHHVMIRGIERRRIFNDDEDRENLIERLSILLPKTKTECYNAMPGYSCLITPSAVSYSVQRRDETAKEEDYQLELQKF